MRTHTVITEQSGCEFSGDNIHEGENDVELVETTGQASVVGDRDVQVTKLEQETRICMTWRNQETDLGARMTSHCDANAIAMRPVGLAWIGGAKLKLGSGRWHGRVWFWPYARVTSLAERFGKRSSLRRHMQAHLCRTRRQP
jgi:hypothetical protein